MTTRVLPVGEAGWLVELPDLEAVWALDATLGVLASDGAEVWHAVVDRVPTARTLLLTVDSPADLPGVRRALDDVLAALGCAAAITPGTVRATQGVPGAIVEIAVTYDGPDLDEVARLTGLTPAEVVAAHTAHPWRVGFTGFAPGFAYLVGGDPRLTVPRRSTPRPSVPAGSVALAGEYAGIYPRASPGGWQVIGHTDAVLWDVDRTPPALLRRGAGVRFIDTALHEGRP
ncbi:MAG: allophanate hydrolase subunit 1 [Propionibacteriaceae bacterium]|nr:allophanate hydrolase subunit 1 [Propionibacteriaceae bacterium]